MPAASRFNGRSVPGRARRAIRLPPRELLTILHVVAVMVFVESVIRWVPLMTLSRWLGIRVDLTPARAGTEQMKASELPAHARRQLRCSRRVADVWPLSRGPCLRRSLVAGHLLRAHNPAVRLGVATTGGSIQAHAWLEIDHRPLESVADLKVFHETPTGIQT